MIFAFNGGFFCCFVECLLMIYNFGIGVFKVEYLVFWERECKGLIN